MKTLRIPALITVAIASAALTASAQNYTVSYTDGGSWNTVYAQGFSTSLGATPNPGLANGGPVTLSGFQFYKSGNADSAANFQLAIFNTMYPNTVGLSTASGSFVGLSANTIASTAALSLGAAISFNFNNLALTYGNDYSAMFVNVGGGGSLTPVLVSALTANYVDVGGGSFHPASNYGTESQFQYTTANFIQGNGFFSAFSFAGDANFQASLVAVPEPGTTVLMGLGAVAAMFRVLRRKAAKK
jgi:hypothetical protein